MSGSSKKVVHPLDVLVVENHADTLQYLRIYVEQLGHSVRCATSVADGLEALSQRPTDVLLCDIGLSDGDGWTLMQKTTHPPAYAVAMSGFGMGSDESRSKAAGFRRHLSKPFTPEQLEQILEEAQNERDGP